MSYVAECLKHYHYFKDNIYEPLKAAEYSLLCERLAFVPVKKHANDFER